LTQRGKKVAKVRHDRAPEGPFRAPSPSRSTKAGDLNKTRISSLSFSKSTFRASSAAPNRCAEIPIATAGKKFLVSLRGLIYTDAIVGISRFELPNRWEA
jgi:hypothetical protein